MNKQKYRRPLFPHASGDQTGFWLTRTLQQAEVLLLAIFGFLFCLITSYQLDVLTARLIWSSVFFALFFLIIFSLRRRWILLLLCFAALAYWLLRNSEELTQGMLLLADQALGTLGLRLPDALQVLLQYHNPQDAVLLATVALQTLQFAVTLFSAFFIVRRPSTLGLAFSTLPMLLPAPFFLQTPDVVPFFCLAAALLMLYILNSAAHMPSKILQADLKSAPPALRQPLFDQKQAQQLLALFALPIIVLAALVSNWVLPQDGYQRPESIEGLQEKIFSLKFGDDSSQMSNDGLTHGAFRTLSDIRFSGETAIQVRVSQEQIYYLRDYAGSLYTQNGWESVSNSVYEAYAENFSDIRPQNLFAAAAAASSGTYEAYTISVKRVSASKTSFWIPFGLATNADELSGVTYLQDTALVYAGNPGGEGYTIEALSSDTTLSAVDLGGAEASADSLKTAYLAAAGAAVNLSGAGGASAQAAQSAAMAYIDYVFTTYTALPDDTRSSAEEICAAAGLSLRTEDGKLSLYNTCFDMHDYLTTQCAYAYSPPEVPASEDFVLYFLEESRLGYCVHFASAATVLLRSLGIPARYAEGYIVVRSDYEKTPDAEGYIDIEDTHAHAWVEVFDPALLEWIPVEMTASAIRNSESTPNPDAEESSDDADSAPEPTATPTPEPTATPTPQAFEDPSASTSPDEEGAPEETPAAEPDQAESEGQPDMTEATPTPGTESDGFSESDSDADDDGEAHEATTGASRTSLWPLLVLAGIATVLLSAMGWRRALRGRRKKIFYQRNTNAAAIAICRIVLDMLLFAGCEPMQPNDSPEDYAYAVTKRLPWIDRQRLENLLELAQRARFSGKIISRQERNSAAAFAGAVSGRLHARLPRLRRWLFYWLYPEV
jgi:cell division septation protein DedD